MISKIFNLVLNTCLNVFSVGFSLFILLCCVPIYLMVSCTINSFRLLTGVFGKLFKRDFVRLLSTTSSVHFEEKKNVIFTIFLEDDINIEYLRKFFETQVLNCRNENDELQYPKLQQKICSLFGFCYWKWDKKFNIENHIRYFNRKENDTGYFNEKGELKTIGSDELNDMFKILMYNPFQEDQSPWEMYLVKHYSSKEIPNASVVICKFSHGMTDIYSFVKMLYYSVGGTEKSVQIVHNNNSKRSAKNESEELPPKSPVKSTIKILSALYSLIFNRIKHPSNFFDRNEWHPCHSKIHKTYHIGRTKSISMKTVEAISMTHKIPQLCVIFAGITGGIRQMMLKGNVPLPNDMRVSYPIFAADKPKHALSNHFVYADILLPTGKADPIARLLAIHERMQELEKSEMSSLMKMAWKFNGALFHKLAIRFSKSTTATLSFNCVSLPSENLTLFDSKVITVEGLPIIQNGDFGVLATIVGHDNLWNLSLMVHWSLLANGQEVDELNQFIEEEFHILETYKLGSRHRKQSIFSLAAQFNQ